jgi:hypothetical protein
MQQDHIRPSAAAPFAVIGRGHHFGDNARIGGKSGTRHERNLGERQVLTKRLPTSTQQTFDKAEARGFQGHCEGRQSHFAEERAFVGRLLTRSEPGKLAARPSTVP